MLREYETKDQAPLSALARELQTFIDLVGGYRPAAQLLGIGRARLEAIAAGTTPRPDEA